MCTNNIHMMWVHIGIASLRQFQCVPTTYVTENKETYFEIFTKQLSIMSIVVRQYSGEF